MVQTRKRGGRATPAGRLSGSETESPAGHFIRMIWMGPGNLVLLFLVGSIARLPPWSISWRDVAFWWSAATLIVVRYVDVARFDGLTIHAEPATQQHVRRYATILVALALVTWVIAQSFQA